MIRSQRTLSHPVTFSGIGIHTGKKVTMTFRPAPADTGISFRRIDLPGEPSIPAAIEYVVDTARSTTLGVGSVTIHTVEHVLAALYALQIDNLIIDLDACEPPVGDGSSNPFVGMIHQGGIFIQEATKRIESIPYPVFISEQNIHLIALPSQEYRVSYTLHYPQVPLIRSQFFSTIVEPDAFIETISPCRTFARYEEITYLMSRGLIQGGSLDNAVVIKEDVIVSKGGLRFPDEMVRHKILDLIGDLSLVGFPFFAHIVAICSGHHTNVALGKKLLESMAVATSEIS